MKHRFKKGEDPQIICRRALLNTLIRGPVVAESIVASAERDFGFRREDVFAAAQWFNVVEEWCDGQRIWRKCSLCFPSGTTAVEQIGLRQESHESWPKPLT